MGTNLGLISYGVGAVSFTVLFIVLVIGYRGQSRSGGLLLAAVGINTVWLAVSAYASYVSDFLPPWVQIMETLRDGAWYAFLLQALGFSFDYKIQSLARRTALLIFILVSLQIGILLGEFFLSGNFASLLNYKTVLIGQISFAIIGLMLVEQLLRSVPREKRWAVKYLCLGLGGLFIYDFFLYTDALLLQAIDAGVWFARGLVNAIVVPFIAVSAARNLQWSPDVYVSRWMVFHTATFLGAGLYLLAMASAGYYVRYFGESWGVLAQAVFSLRLDYYFYPYSLLID